MTDSRIRRLVDNPVLRREALKQLGFSGRRPWVRRVFWTLVMGWVLVPSTTMWMNDHNPAYLQRMHEINSAATTTVCCLLAPLLTIGAITGERERGTWDTLRSTRLPAISLAAGKWLGNLAPVWLIWAAMLPIRLITGPGAGMHPLHWVMEELVLLSSIGASGAIGLWVSSIRTTTRNAISTLVVVAMVANIATSVLRWMLATQSPGSLPAWEPLLAILSPWTLVSLARPGFGAVVASRELSAGLVGMLGQIGVVALVLRSVARRATAVG